MKKFNVIVIGLGRIGMMYAFDSYRIQPASHVSAILYNNNLNLIGVCDPDKKLRSIFKKKFDGEYIIENNHVSLIKNLIDQDIDCDIIVIATPENSHSEILDYCIKKFKNKTKKTIIFCEKPLTNNFVNAKKIKTLIKNSKIKIVVNHSRRWSNIWQQAYLWKKSIGNIQKASFYFSTSPENKNSSQIRDGIHLADVINWFELSQKIEINRLNLSYFLYDFHMWGTKGKIEIIDFGTKLNLFNTVKSSHFKKFKELKLKKSVNLNESYLIGPYKEFVGFLTNKNKLSTSIDDAIMAVKIFDKYVYDKRYPR